MMVFGLALQVITDSPFLGVPLLVHFSEVTALSGFAIVGALIVSRHPWHPVGWLWLFITFSFGRDHFVWGYAYYGYFTHPDSLPGVKAAIVLLYGLGRGSMGIAGITLLLLLFPTGKPLSSGWLVIAWITISVAIIAIPLRALTPDPIGYFPFPTDLLNASETVQIVLNQLRRFLTIGTLQCFLAAMISLIIRLIRSRGVERQQLKWFVYSAAFLPPAFFLIFMARSQQALISNWTFLLGPIFGVTASLGMAAASAIAIFRYRLYDIDIIINRTVVYGLLTGTLALIYFSSVLLLQQIFQTLTGQGSPLVIVMSTLIIAGLFSPLRKRIQEFIDKRFYRRRYNAEVTLANFAALARDQIDLDDLSTELQKVVKETLQPEHLSIWLRKVHNQSMSIRARTDYDHDQ